MTLRDVAHSRAGDKGTTINCSVIAYDAADFVWLSAVVTEERVRAHLGDLIHGEVRRYVVPELSAMNFVMTRAPGNSADASASQPTVSAFMPSPRRSWAGAARRP